MSSRVFYVREYRRLGALAFLHPGSAFLCELDRGHGLNEIGMFQHGERDQVVLSRD